MSLRVSAGSLKGRRLRPPVSGGVRPTSAKVREALFNILAGKVGGAVFVDLFAGTGAVGIEAMSRDAAKVIFVDAGRGSIKEITRTLEGCGSGAGAEVVHSGAMEFIQRAGREGRRFDVVFMDPPYASGELLQVLGACGDSPALADDARVAAEHPSSMELPDVLGRLRKLKTYRYGGTALTIMAPIARKDATRAQPPPGEGEAKEEDG